MIFGVIGVGNMGKNHVRVLTEIKKVEEVVVYDANPTRAKEVADAYEVSTAESMDSLLREVDAVSICSPTSLHFHHIKRAVDSGKHVLVEKPITSSYDEARKVLEMVEGKDFVFGVGHIERFNPVVSELVRVGVDAVYVEMKRHNPASIRMEDSTVVEDLMIHDIDILFNVLFPDVEDFRISSAGTRSVVQVLINSGDSVASLSASRISSKKIRRLYIENENFTVEGDLMTQEMYIYRRPAVYKTINEKYLQENVIEKVLINKIEPLKVELKAFVDAVEGKQDFPVTAEQAVKNLKICEIIKKDIRL
ncbi:Gfo/Idh/MocA family protein [Archaeoglobus neptunius]|uniref:Gfo/Idh/MocA family protein n=1 Tax=Archaeoglobus neptunius TaxID=2798580 RepID=UPI001926C81D|nr:Gfo/Idh/MocA family oxidoreductase [Archaeoglobus neptunius]